MNRVAFNNLLLAYRFVKHIPSNRKCFSRCANNVRVFQNSFKFLNRVHLKNGSRNISQSNWKKSDNKSNETSVDDSEKKMLEDEDFQDILKDFAKDFGLNDDSRQILEDIKNSFDEDDKNQQPPPEKHRNETVDELRNETPNKLGEKFKDFSETDSFVIPSHEDILSGKFDDSGVFHIDREQTSHRTQIDLSRGVDGVFDIEQLVDVLRKENLQDITVIAIERKNISAEYMVLATAKSPRHSDAAVEYLLKLYKMKKHRKDPFIIVEGEKCPNWKVMDMGNIFCHIMSEETRTYYDIESAWLFDAEFDSGGTLKPDPVFDIIEEQMEFFKNLQDQPSPLPECPKDTS